jgi:hypothetical protein
MKDQNETGRSVSEHIALRDALTTLAELHKIAYAGSRARVLAANVVALPVKMDVL